MTEIITRYILDLHIILSPPPAIHIMVNVPPSSIHHNTREVDTSSGPPFASINFEPIIEGLTLRGSSRRSDDLIHPSANKVLSDLNKESD